MGSHKFQILTNDGIPWIQSYMLELLLHNQEIVEIPSKNRFLGTFLGVFGFHPLTPYELQPNFWLNKRSHRDTQAC